MGLTVLLLWLVKCGLCEYFMHLKYLSCLIFFCAHTVPHLCGFEHGIVCGSDQEPLKLKRGKCQSLNLDSCHIHRK